MSYTEAILRPNRKQVIDNSSLAFDQVCEVSFKFPLSPIQMGEEFMRRGDHLLPVNPPVH